MKTRNSILLAFLLLMLASPGFAISDLKGPWTLFKDTLLSPAAAARLSSPDQLKLPGYIESVKSSVPNYGHHTLQLKLENLNSGQIYGIHLPEVFSAYRFFINDSLYATNGTVGTSASTMLPEWAPGYIYFRAADSPTILTYQISNYVYNWCGFMIVPQVAPHEEMIRSSRINQFLDIALFGAIGMICLYHLMLYALRRKDKSALAFGIVSGFFAFRTLVTGELLLKTLVPSLHWEILVKLNFGGIALGLASLAWYIKTLYPDLTHKRFLQGYYIVNFLYLSFVLFTPAAIHSPFLSLMHLTLLVGMIYFIATLIRAVRKKHKEAWIPLIAMAILMLTALNDVLVAQEVINSFQMAPLGLLSFLAAQAFLISKRFSEAFIENEWMAIELAEANRTLEEKVEDRTRDLEEKNAELKEALENVKVLTGLLPVCCSCHKVKEDDGYKRRLEEYLLNNSDITISHGLCPDCRKKLYPEFPKRPDKE